MTPAPGVYVARCTGHSGSQVNVLIPQVFADVQVPLHLWVGDTPQPQTTGIVSFVGGDPTYPVWLGAASPA